MDIIDLVPGKFQSSSSPAIIYNGRIITSGELDDAINKRAEAFSKYGITSRTPVGIISEHNPDFIINVFAIWKLGASAVPVNTKLTQKEIDSLLEFSGCPFAIDNGSIRSLSDKYDTAIDDDTALIIFTSGSTGKPKGVKLSFGNLLSSANSTVKYLGQVERDRWLASLPFYHVGGFLIIIRSFLAGAAVIIPKSISLEDLCAAINSEKPSYASFVSTQLLRLLKNGCGPNPELKNVLLGGGFINSSLIYDAAAKGWKLTKVYGSSETSSMVTALDCGNSEKIESAGTPLPGNSIAVVDEKGKLLPANCIGEIIIKGPSVANGYLNNNEETKSKFKKGFYYSGDIGWLDDDGYLYIEARRTDLIISGGENINPAEVEQEILKHPAISEAVVFAVEDNEWGHIAAAAIVFKENQNTTVSEICEFLSDKIAGYKIPKIIKIVKELPKTSLGKIRRDKLIRIISS